MKAANVFIHKDEATGKQFVKIGDLGVAKLLSHTNAFATTVRERMKEEGGPDRNAPSPS